MTELIGAYRDYAKAPKNRTKIISLGLSGVPCPLVKYNNVFRKTMHTKEKG
jgi:hypothetical protein